MSGAEAFVAIGIASNFVQLLQFATSLARRIKEYSSGAGTPKRIATQADRLSDLLNVLKCIEQSSGGNPLDEKVLSRCQAQAQELSELLEALKGSDGSRFKNARKAFKSLSKSDQIEKFQAVLDSLVNTLSLQLQADTRSTTKNVENSAVALLAGQFEQTSLLREIKQGTTVKVNSNSAENCSQKHLWLVPIGRNLSFVGRSTIINTLEHKLTPVPDSVRTAVLCGLGGVGKSQIALEYLYRMKARTADLSAIWVHASSNARFIESYQRIATECNIPGKDDSSSDVLQLVRDWLETSYERKFLMIIDNVDDRSTFFVEATSTGKGKSLGEYIPQCSRGTVVYTTRSRDIGIDLSLDRDPISVPSMEVEEARSLLGENIRSQSTNEEQLELLEELDFLPLAICQATAFMMKRKRRISDYLKMYKSEETRSKLLDQKFNYHGREARQLESVISTWWISFDSIRTENSRAADLLSIMSYMDYQAIPFSLLIGDSEDKFDFEEAMGLLEAFSLVTLDRVTFYCQVHRLVTVATQAWLAHFEEEPHRSALEALNIMYGKFPDTGRSHQQWSTCSTYLPHAESVLRHNSNQTTRIVACQKASLSLKVSDYLNAQGQFKDSERLSGCSMRLFEENNGRDDEQTLNATFSYASALFGQGKYHESLALHREVLAGREEVVGHDHRATLASLDEVGRNLYALGFYREAEDIHRKELSGKAKLLNIDEDSYSATTFHLIALTNIAWAIASQGRYAEAEKIQREALERSEAFLGSKHPDLLYSRSSLIMAIQYQGRLAEAEDMLIALLCDSIAILGEKHYGTLVTLSNLATVKAQQGNLEQAESMYRKALRLNIETLGENHPSAINNMHNLACIAFNRASYAEAENVFRKCLGPQMEAFGSTHPDTLHIRRNIAKAIWKQGRWEDADKMDYQSIKLCRTAPETREMEPEIASFLKNICDGLDLRERYQEAEPIRRQELDLRIAAGEENSPEMFNCLGFLGDNLSRQGKLGEAIQFYERAVKYNSSNLGRYNEMVKRTTHNLAMAYRDTDRFELAEQTFRKLLNLQEETSEPLDTTLFHLGSVLSKQGKYAESEKTYRKILMSLRELPPESDTLLNRASVMNNLATVLADQNNLSGEADDLLWEVYHVRREVLGVEHELTIKSRQSMVDYLHYRGKDTSVAFEKLRASGVPVLIDEEQEDGHHVDSEWEDCSTEDEEESDPAKDGDKAQDPSQEQLLDGRMCG